jgi:glycosyltransferase involved in cell wall biosynthesis
MPISVVMPAYNAERHIDEAVRSVVAQTATNWELVIVDDGSQDDTSEIARAWADKDSRIRTISQGNAGVSAARNLGIEASDPSRPLLICLDSDDTWVPNALALGAAPGCSACYGGAAYIDSEGVALPSEQLDNEQFRRRTLRGSVTVALADEEPTDFAALNINDGCRIVTPGQVLARREAVLAAGCFENGLGFCEDWDLWLRLSRQGPLAFCRGVVLHYRMHPGGASNKKRPMVDGHRHVRRKVLSIPNLTREERRAAEFGYRYYCGAKLRYALDAFRRGAIREGAMQCARAAASHVRCLADIRSSRPTNNH